MNGFGQGMNGNGMMGNGFTGPNVPHNDFNNNYFSGMSVNSFPRYNIIQVRGRNGAEAFQMAPNSKILLLDESDPLVWFVQTDGAGYKTVTPYTITPYQPAPPVDLNNLEARLSALEERLNAKSYNGTNKQSRNKQTRNEQSNGTIEATDPAI